MTSPRSPVDVGTFIDRGGWGPYQRRLVAMTALCIVFDGIDNQLMGVAIPTIMREWSLPRSAFAPVVSLGYLGMMVGGALAGIAGDRFGRRVALLGSMLTFGMMTLAIGLTDSLASLGAVDVIAMLGALRFLAGLGLGGAIPNAAALAAEYVPVSHRPMAVTVTIVCVPVGGTLAGLIAIPLLPAIGWRLLFVAGGVLPVLAALALARRLPESPRFLARHPARHAELAGSLEQMGHVVPPGTAFVDATATASGGASIRTLFQREFRRDTVALWGAFLTCLLAVYLGFAWVPAMLTGAGLSSSVASTGITVFNLGGVAGALAGGLCIARWGSRRSMLVMAALAVVSAGAMSTMNLVASAAVLPIIVMLAVTGGLINGVQATMYALAAHVYPASIRATGVGTAVSFGRTGAVLSGYVGAWALEYRGTTSFFATMALAMIACGIALSLVKRHVPAR